MADSETARTMSRRVDAAREALDDLLAAEYQELRRLARSHMRRERDGHTLSPTGLLHEAWLKLASPGEPAFQNRAHFFGAASEAMRRVLVDHARGRSARKRQAERISLTGAGDLAGDTPPFHELLAVNGALEGLAAISPRLVQVVECRYFAGLTIPETAEALGISHTTVSEDWRFARAWLRRTLSGVPQELLEAEAC